MGRSPGADFFLQVKEHSGLGKGLRPKATNMYYLHAAG